MQPLAQAGHPQLLNHALQLLNLLCTCALTAPFSPWKSWGVFRSPEGLPGQSLPGYSVVLGAPVSWANPCQPDFNEASVPHPSQPFTTWQPEAPGKPANIWWTNAADTCLGTGVPGGKASVH